MVFELFELPYSKETSLSGPGILNSPSKETPGGTSLSGPRILNFLNSPIKDTSHHFRGPGIFSVLNFVGRPKSGTRISQPGFLTFLSVFQSPQPRNSDSRGPGC